MKIYGKRVAVQIIENNEEKKSKGGFILPYESKPYNTGIVKYVSESIDIQFKSGQLIHFLNKDVIKFNDILYIVDINNIFASK